MQNYTISHGFSDPERPRLAALYWEAFGPKLGRVLGPERRALDFFAPVLDPDHAIVARDPTGQILGMAGFKTPKGAFIGGRFRDLARVYGRFGAIWRAALVSLLERDVERGVLLMDGICVAAEGRGRGIGTALLSAIKIEAAKRALTRVRLDVINTNPRAQALYEREGFVPGPEQSLGALHFVFGFSSARRLDFAVIAA